MAYTRAEDVQIDAWETIGNEGWTWKNLFPYYLKSENFTKPTKTQLELGASYNLEYNGENGPLNVAFTKLESNSLTTYLNRTFQAMGLPWSEDLNGGKMRGFNIFPATINYEEYVREDAARAYYWPYESRENLHVLLNTFANRAVWAEGTGSEPVTAKGVEVTLKTGAIGTIGATKEVIVSAGALKTPAILELSGIGNPDILHKHNISVKVDLPTVGENLQDQTNSHMDASSNRTLSGGKPVSYPNIYDILGDEAETVGNKLRANLKKYAEESAKANGNVMKAADLERLFEVQYDLIFKKNTPVAEILNYAADKTLSTEFWSLLPFARGNVHIASANPKQFPTINPNYFMFEWDVESFAAVGQYIRRSYETKPLSTLVKEATPGLKNVPQDASVEQWKEWVFDGNCTFFITPYMFVDPLLIICQIVPTSTLLVPLL